MSLNPQTWDVQFIDETTFKDRGVVNENVDMKIIAPIINLCQEKYLTKILGTGLYVDLQNKIYNTVNNISGSTQLNTDENNLILIYIQEALFWLVMRDLPLHVTYKMMNKGLSTQSSDTSSPASLGDIQSYQADAKNNADWYSQRLSNYLVAHTFLFPAYLQVRTLDDVVPSFRQYTTSINLTRRPRYGTWWGGRCEDCDPRAFYFY